MKSFSLRNKVFLLILMLYPIFAFPQIPNGSWRDHLSYIKGKQLAISPKKVYYIAENSGMLSYDKKSGEIEKYTTITGLSDIDISSLYYSETYDLLMICYATGNIDILTKNGIINFPDVYNKYLLSTKRINHIESYKNFLYLACDFGIVKFDLEKLEISESYFLSEGGKYLKINDIAILDDTIYAASETGIYRAVIDGRNLLDFSNWEHLNGINGFNNNFPQIETFSNRVFAEYVDSTTNSSNIIVLNKGIWSPFNAPYDTVISGLTAHSGLLAIIGDNKTIFLNSDLNILFSFDKSGCFDAQRDNDGNFYFAVRGTGFSRVDASNNESFFSINSPRYNSIGQVFAYKDQVWVGSGGPFNLWQEGGAYNFSNNTWHSINNGWTAGLEGVGNIYKISYLPSDQNTIFASGNRFGLYIVQKNNDDFQVVQSYTYNNSDVLQAAIADPIVNVRIMGQGFDSKENFWFVNDIIVQPLFVLRKNGHLEHLNINLSMFKNPGTSYQDLIVTKSDQVWILSRLNGIIVVKEEPDGTLKYRNFSIRNQQDELIVAANCLTEDKDGRVWVGTNKGPLFYDTQGDDIFTEENVIGRQVAIPRNDGTNYADYLLDYVYITDIAIDGGNNKWIGTESSGVYLVSADGMKTYKHFTQENSPLYSNNIIGLDVQQNTGEVFISTNRGLISFMGNATEGLSDYKDVYVYPDPVRPGYDGDITITGLVENSNVKITDISGNLVYETTSEGGKAVWNGYDFNGERAHTGVYLVFLSNSDGSKTYITKFLFIH
jgi:hypothetical protein